MQTVADVYGITTGMVSKWCNQEEKIREADKGGRKMHPGPMIQNDPKGRSGTKNGH